MRWFIQLTLPSHRQRSIGWSKNKDRTTLGRETIASIGLGLRWSVTRSLNAQVYWGHQLDNVDTEGDLQDDGFQFLVSVDFP